MPYKAKWELDKDREELARLKFELVLAKEDLKAADRAKYDAQDMVKELRVRMVEAESLIEFLPDLLPHLLDEYAQILWDGSDESSRWGTVHVLDTKKLLDDLRARKIEKNQDDNASKRTERLRRAGLGTF